jgi:hypothetical protein
MCRGIYRILSNSLSVLHTQLPPSPSSPVIHLCQQIPTTYDLRIHKYDLLLLAPALARNRSPAVVCWRWWPEVILSLSIAVEAWSATAKLTWPPGKSGNNNFLPRSLLVVPWLRRLVTGLPAHILEFNAEKANVGFCGGQSGSTRGFYTNTWIFLYQYYSHNASHLFISYDFMEIPQTE